MRAMKILFMTLLGLFSGLSAEAASEHPISLSFGVYSSDKPSSMVRQFRPVLNALERRMTEIHGQPIKIRMHVAKSYEQGLNDLVSGKVDFARFGPASYVRAKEMEPRISILVLESKKGRKVFNGVFCVNKDSPIHEIAQLRGKSVAFGDEQSTIGRFLAQLYLVRHQIRSNDLAHYEYLGRHDAVGAAVGAGRFDAGALKESTFKKLVAEGIPLRVIAKFPNVTKPWIARGGLPEETVGLMREALLSLDDPKAMKALKKDGFVEGSDEDFSFIREAMLGNNQFFESRPSVAERRKKH